MAGHGSATSFDTEKLSDEAIARANERLANLPQANQPAAPPPAEPAGARKPRSSNREPGTKGILLQLNEEQHKALESAAKKGRRSVADHIKACVEDNFLQFIVLE